MQVGNHCCHKIVFANFEGFCHYPTDDSVLLASVNQICPLGLIRILTMDQPPHEEILAPQSSCSTTYSAPFPKDRLALAAHTDSPPRATPAPTHPRPSSQHSPRARDAGAKQPKSQGLTKAQSKG